MDKDEKAIQDNKVSKYLFRQIKDKDIFNERIYVNFYMNNKKYDILINPENDMTVLVLEDNGKAVAIENIIREEILKIKLRGKA